MDESVVDVEKNGLPADPDSVDVAKSNSKSLSWWEKIIALGVEERGVMPVPVKERTSDRFINVFSIWFSMSVTPLGYVLSCPALVCNMLTRIGS